MAEWAITTTDEEIDAALDRARNTAPAPYFTAASYHPDLDVIEWKISDGRRLVFPRENLQALSGSTPENAADFNTGPHGSHIWWPQLDEGHYLANLLEGRTGNDPWMDRLQRLHVAA